MKTHTDTDRTTHINQGKKRMLAIALLGVGTLLALPGWLAAAIIDDFDDNNLDEALWELRYDANHGGAVSVTGRQLHFTGNPVGSPYDFGVTTDDQSFSIPDDGSTLEFSVDLIQGATDGNFVFLAFGVGPFISPPAVSREKHYTVLKSDTRLSLLKNVGPNAFFDSFEPVKNDNVKLVLSLSGSGSSVMITVKILDLENGNAVLFERSVTDTSGVDPMVLGSDSPPESHVGAQGGIALLFHNTATASSEIILDNASVTTRDPKLAIEPAVILSWPLSRNDSVGKREHRLVSLVDAKKSSFSASSGGGPNGAP